MVRYPDTPIPLHAWATVSPCARATSASRSFPIISSTLRCLLAIDYPLSACPVYESITGPVFGGQVRIGEDLRRVHQEFHERLGSIDTPEKEAKHDELHKALEERVHHLLAERSVPPGPIRSQRAVGQLIEVTGVASFCLVVAPHRAGGHIVLAPGMKVPVAVRLNASPDVSLERHNFTILVDAHDLAENTDANAAPGR